MKSVNDSDFFKMLGDLNDLEYEIIKEVYKGNSIEKLWNELEICQKHIAIGIQKGGEIADCIKESLVISYLIKQKSLKSRKRFLRKLRKEAEKASFGSYEEFQRKLKRMNFFGKEYVWKQYLL